MRPAALADPLCGSLCDLCASVVSVFPSNFTTEAQSALAPVSWTRGLGCSARQLLLILQRTEIAKGRMAPLPVVPDLDVLEDRAARRGASGPRLTIEQFPFERSEEALSDRVGIAVCATAHTGS